MFTDSLGRKHPTTRTYSVFNSATRACLGDYDATSAQHALDLCARDAGYRDHAHACQVTGDRPDALVAHVLF